ncbi:MAG TPA: protein kinase, partial [Rubrobacter sp.]|nr:protein kinase [Rubrobacter sp.]
MDRLGGRFVLVRELGSGGMSRVFLGRDEVLDRPVAVKILHPDLDDEEAGALFRREGRMAARLSHPNVVPVYDAGEDVLGGHEVSYIVMEYVPCGHLRGLIDRRGALPEPMLARLGADVAAALAHAHERGIVHRDVKPQNVL